MDNYEKIPPQNLEAEQSFLGSVLLNKDSLLKVADIVNPEDFYKDAHEKIFEVILELYENNDPIDLVSLSNRLEEKKILENIGGRSYLTKLADSVVTSSGIVHYAEIIHHKATRRRLLAASQNIIKMSYEEDESTIETLLDQAQKKLFSVSNVHLKQTFSPIRNVLTDAFERIDDLHKHKGQMRGVPTGFKSLDNLLAGLQKSDLVILAARPSVGKTSLALDIVRHVGTEAKIPVGLFSLEMSKEQLVDRLLCSQGNIDLWKLRTGNLSSNPNSDDFPRIGHAIGVLSESPIYIDDTPNLNIMQIRTKARRLQSEHGLGLIVIDYLQLMESHGGNKSDGRVQEVAAITRGLKGIARELNIPVLALSQLSRVVEQSKPAIPKLSHLRESGSIEQDADVVMFIYRKSADRNYRPEEIPPDEQNMAEIHIAKHRNGPTGIVKTIFVAKQASFKNLEVNLNESHASQPAGGQPQKQGNSNELKSKEYYQKKNASPKF